MPTATDTRARLLAAARQAFADLGYGRARVEDVVARAGVGHGTFYAYFKNKRAALAALISENAATLVDLAGQPWRPATSGPAWSRSWAACPTCTTATPT